MFNSKIFEVTFDRIFKFAAFGFIICGLIGLTAVSFGIYTVIHFAFKYW